MPCKYFSRRRLRLLLPHLSAGLPLLNQPPPTPLRCLQSQSYTNYFADALVAEAKKDARIVGIHAAMGGGTGMNRFEKASQPCAPSSMLNRAVQRLPTCFASHAALLADTPTPHHNVHFH